MTADEELSQSALSAEVVAALSSPKVPEYGFDHRRMLEASMTPEARARVERFRREMRGMERLAEDVLERTSRDTQGETSASDVVAVLFALGELGYSVVKLEARREEPRAISPTSTQPPPVHHVIRDGALIPTTRGGLP